MQVVPAILEKTPEEFIFQFNRLRPYFNHFQIDIADGQFVPNKTVQIEELSKTIEQYSNITMKQFSFDFHLMVKDYKKEIKKLMRLLARRSLDEGGKKFVKIKNVLIHYSLNPNFQFLISNFSCFAIGLVLDTPDQISDLGQKYGLDKIPLIQIMTINPGFQGSPFLPEMLNKIEQLRISGYRNKILIDGSVNDKTLPIILARKYQPDILCVGSFLTKAKDLKGRLKLLEFTLRESLTTLRRS